MRQRQVTLELRRGWILVRLVGSCRLGVLAQFDASRVSLDDARAWVAKQPHLTLMES